MAHAPPDVGLAAQPYPMARGHGAPEGPYGQAGAYAPYPNNSGYPVAGYTNVMPPTNAPARGPAPEGRPVPRPESLGGEDVLKVAGSSNVKALAGAIANRIREGNQAKAVALGSSSVNQAVKALAIARAYLEADQMDLAVRPEFIHIPGQGPDEPQRSALRFNIVARPPGALRAASRETDSSATQLKIAGHTSPLSAAGAVAKRVREHKKCVIIAMGAESVNQAVKTIAIGRTYLEEDMLDINFKPRFVHVDMGEDEKKSAVEMTILINQL
eukprot:NODE_884_length_1135_cov_117.538690_g842_i0.p1 GENE.NODE_884_length_1135_cov_117.538690_g842_i0~~NODE_884_length_1135_cov_117.538690_g842_i0.p1  ORF type:complete len:271 (+),score=35.45 NODE_884_length_1135_cov_117.538690_g842_i0:63-875(+)